jgi:hypothetical protein
MTTKTHISVLAAYYANSQGSEREEIYQETFDLFNAANAKSLVARYGDAVERNLHKGALSYFVASRIAAGMSPVEIIKAARCFEYQSCEDWWSWNGSRADKRLRAILEEATSRLPGYDKARWSIPDSVEDMSEPMNEVKTCE